MCACMENKSFCYVIYRVQEFWVVIGQACTFLDYFTHNYMFNSYNACNKDRLHVDSLKNYK